jgi:hypothetical protein
VTYEDERLEGEIYIHAGLFDEADRLVPDRHAYVTVQAVLDPSGGRAGQTGDHDAAAIACV